MRISYTTSEGIGVKGGVASLDRIPESRNVPGGEISFFQKKNFKGKSVFAASIKNKRGMTAIMLYILMGPNCAGKSTAAEELAKLVGGQVFSGKDYLRFARNPNVAWEKFKEEMLAYASEDSVGTLIYEVTEPELAEELLAIEEPNVEIIKFTGDLEILKRRFSIRMKRQLPPPVEKMLETKYGMWEKIDVENTINTSWLTPEEVVEQILHS